MLVQYRPVGISNIKLEKFTLGQVAPALGGALSAMGELQHSTARQPTSTDGCACQHVLSCAATVLA